MVLLVNTYQVRLSCTLRKLQQLFCLSSVFLRILKFRNVAFSFEFRTKITSNLPCLYSTFHLEYPLVLSRFCCYLFQQNDYISNFENIICMKNKLYWQTANYRLNLEVYLVNFGNQWIDHDKLYTRKGQPFIYILSNFNEFLLTLTPSAATIDWSG